MYVCMYFAVMVCVVNSADIDECELMGRSDCHADAECRDTVGSYDCTCKSGYTGNGTYCAGRFEYNNTSI